MTINDEKIPPEKEVYRLWWEYLKRSQHYKAYCDAEPQAIKIVEKKDGTYSTAIMNPKTKKLTTKKVSYDQFLHLWNMQRNFDAFGNIFKTSFDNWWKKRKIKKELPVLVLNAPDVCAKLPYFVEQYNDLKKPNGENPSPAQVLELLTKSEFNYIFLAVPMVGNVTMEEISKQIASIRMKYNKQPFFRLADYNFKRFAMPISRVRFDELKRYLRVYDLKQAGLTMKKIIAEIDPDRKGFDADVVRSFRSDLQKARNLIDNAERGLFPEEPIITR